MADQFLQMASLGGITAPVSSARHRAAPITAALSIATLTAEQALAYARVLFPVFNVVRDMTPAATPQAPTVFTALKPAAGGSFQVGALNLVGMTCTSGDVSGYTAMAAISLETRYTVGATNHLLQTSTGVTGAVWAEYMMALARGLTGGIYEQMPSYVSALTRGGRDLDVATEDEIRRVTGDTVFSAAKAMGLERKTAYAGGMLGDPAVRVTATNMAATTIRALEVAVWPQLRDWLRGQIQSSLNPLKYNG